MPPTAGPSVCPVISAIENTAIAAPRRAAGALVANSVMPVVFVRADETPRKNIPARACASDCALPRIAAEIATPRPVPASAGPGGRRSAIRPAGRSIVSRPTANAVVRKARSAAPIPRSRPISGSSGARMNDAIPTASTTPPGSSIGALVVLTNVCIMAVSVGAGQLRLGREAGFGRAGGPLALFGLYATEKRHGPPTRPAPSLP